jgi:hypothetical protein
MTEMGTLPSLPTAVVLDLLRRSGAPAYDQHMIGAVLTSNTSDETKYRQLTALTTCQDYEPPDPSMWDVARRLRGELDAIHHQYQQGAIDRTTWAARLAEFQHLLTGELWLCLRHLQRTRMLALEHVQKRRTSRN